MYSRIIGFKVLQYLCVSQCPPRSNDLLQLVVQFRATHLLLSQMLAEHSVRFFYAEGSFTQWEPDGVLALRCCRIGCGTQPHSDLRSASVLSVLFGRVSAFVLHCWPPPALTCRLSCPMFACAVGLGFCRRPSLTGRSSQKIRSSVELHFLRLCCDCVGLLA